MNVQDCRNKMEEIIIIIIIIINKLGL